MLDDFERPHAGRRCPATPSPRRCRSSLQTEGARGDREHLRGAAGGGPGHGGRLQDHRRRTRGDNGLAGPAEERRQGRGRRRRPTRSCKGLFTSFRADTPWLELVIDRAQAKDRGVSIDDVRTTLESTLGPYYINDFNRFGRTWQVNVQAQRRLPPDGRTTSSSCKVRNSQGDMVPLADFATVRFVSGPVLVMRYNMYPSAAVNADAGPGTSSGQAIAHLEADGQRATCRTTMRTEWTELALLQLQTGQHGHVGVPAGGGAGVPGAGGAVRKLVAAAGRHPGGADVPAVRHRRRGHGADGHQHLHADRLPGAGRPGVQERDPDCRVRQGAARGGRGRAARRRWRRASCGCGRSS